MRNIPRPAPFVLISSNHGTLIINRNDYHMVDDTHGYGVGFQIMNQSCFDPQEVEFALGLLQTRRASYGGFELRGGEKAEYIGQSIDYSRKDKLIDMVSIDSLELARLDFMKIDVERMELEVLEGAERSIARFKPQMIIEVAKSDKGKILERLEKAGYRVYFPGLNVLAIHQTDPANERIKTEGDMLWLA